MSHRCVQASELAALVALRSDDPRRLEAMACPRCDSLLRAMDTFLEGDPTIPADESTRAVQAMAAVLAKQAAGAAAPKPRARHEGAARTRRGPLPRWGWGWGLGLAAAVALVIYLGAPEALRPTGPSGVLRGGAGARSLDLPVSWEPAGEDGKVRLAWPAVPGATRYEVELYTAALDTIGAYPAASAPSLLLDGGVFGESGPAGVLCRVRAFGESGPAGTSRLVPLPAR